MFINKQSDSIQLGSMSKISFQEPQKEVVDEKPNDLSLAGRALVWFSEGLQRMIVQERHHMIHRLLCLVSVVENRWHSFSFWFRQSRVIH